MRYEGYIADYSKVAICFCFSGELRNVSKGKQQENYTFDLYLTTVKSEKNTNFHNFLIL